MAKYDLPVIDEDNVLARRAAESEHLDLMLGRGRYAPGFAADEGELAQDGAVVEAFDAIKSFEKAAELGELAAGIRKQADEADALASRGIAKDKTYAPDGYVFIMQHVMQGVPFSRHLERRRSTSSKVWSPILSTPQLATLDSGEPLIQQIGIVTEDRPDPYEYWSFMSREIHYERDVNKVWLLGAGATTRALFDVSFMRLHVARTGELIYPGKKSN